MQLVLSLFPGIGLLDMAFEQEGFCIVRGPDRLWGGRIETFHPPAGKFDGVIGGPPCQLFSVMKRLNPRAGEKHGNLIPEFERCVQEANPAWFLMENVWPDSPKPSVPGYLVHRQCVRDVWVGGETRRARAISFGTREGRSLWIEILALHRPDPEPSVLTGGGGARVPVRLGGSGRQKRTFNGRGGPSSGRRASVQEMARLQGFPAGIFGADTPFTVEAQRRMLGNGVPLAMGRAVAQAVKRAVGP